MKQSIRMTGLLVFGLCIVAGCPPSMESVSNDLLFRNNSDTKVKILLNLAYPDSSLARSIIVRYMDPNEEGYIGNIYELRRLSGLTVIVFDHSYFKIAWQEGVGSPDTYLEEDSILARFSLSKRELDSIDWRLVHP